MSEGIQRGLFRRNEKANENYSTDFTCRLFAEEGKQSLSTKANIFGHWQQEATPSPFDRNHVSKIGAQTSE